MSFSGKYIVKLFSLKKFLISESIFRLVCFCESVESQGYVSRKCIHLKIFEQIGIGMASLHVL